MTESDARWDGRGAGWGAKGSDRPRHGSARQGRVGSGGVGYIFS